MKFQQTKDATRQNYVPNMGKPYSSVAIGFVHLVYRQSRTIRMLSNGPKASIRFLRQIIFIHPIDQSEKEKQTEIKIEIGRQKEVINYLLHYRSVSPPM